ncbi:MAG: SPFH domain-containing protein [Myxococcota bacterium]
MAIWDRITSQFIEIIEWLQDDHDTLVWRFPVRAQEIKNGAKLIVREGQSAIFINEGKMADVFGPGTYTLTTENLPILATLKGWKYGFNSPFKAECYFINTTQVTDLKWGTQNPIMLRDPEFGPIRLRAFGVFAMKVGDPATLMRNVSGTDGEFEVDEILGQLKRMMVSRFTSVLGEAKIPALDLAGNYDELAKKVLPSIQNDFEQMGIKITTLVVENISLPPAVEQVLDKRSQMAILGNMQQYAAYQMAESIPDAAKTPNSMAGAGMGLAAGMNMGNQMASMMGGQPVPGQPGYGVGMQGPGGAVMGGMVPPQPPPQAPAPAQAPAAPAQSGASAADTLVERMKKLDALKAAGLLSDEEYAAKRAEILSEI